MHKSLLKYAARGTLVLKVVLIVLGFYLVEL